MPISKYIKPMGYGEMYEVSPNELSKNLLGKFVQFDSMYPDKIMLSRNTHCLIGVSSPNFLITSDNPKEWPDKYVCNDLNDTYMKNISVAKATAIWDEKNEMEIIKTYKDYIYEPILNPTFKDDLKYVQRIDRENWLNVIILGKCIVFDNGNCIPGQFCEPYDGPDEKSFGIAVPSINTNRERFYVISRVSDKSIMILLK